MRQRSRTSKGIYYDNTITKDDQEVLGEEEGEEDVEQVADNDATLHCTPDIIQAATPRRSMFAASQCDLHRQIEAEDGVASSPLVASNSNEEKETRDTSDDENNIDVQAVKEYLGGRSKPARENELAEAATATSEYDEIQQLQQQPSTKNIPPVEEDMIEPVAVENPSFDFEQYAESNNILMLLLDEDKGRQKQQLQETQVLQPQQPAVGSANEGLAAEETGFDIEQSACKSNDNLLLQLLDVERKKNAALTSKQADTIRLLYEKSQELKKAESQISDLRNDDENRAIIARLESDIEKGREFIRGMEITINRKDNDLCELKTSLQKLSKKKSEELERQTVEINSIKKELEDVRCENIKICAEKAKLESVIEGHQETVKRISTTLEDKEDELIRVQNSLEKVTKKGLDELQSRTTERDNINRALNDSMEENTRLRTENVRLKNELKADNSCRSTSCCGNEISVQHKELLSTVSNLSDALKDVYKRLDSHETKLVTNNACQHHQQLAQPSMPQPLNMPQQLSTSVTSQQLPTGQFVPLQPPLLGTPLQPSLQTRPLQHPMQHIPQVAPQQSPQHQVQPPPPAQLPPHQQPPPPAPHPPMSQPQNQSPNQPPPNHSPNQPPPNQPPNLPPRPNQPLPNQPPPPHSNQPQTQQQQQHTQQLQQVQLQQPQQQQQQEQQLRLVPGDKLYSQTHIKTTMIIADSTPGKININHVKSNIDLSEENVIFKRFPGQTADEIAHYAPKPLSDSKPDQVVVIAGTNDLTRAVYDGGHINEYEIVENIMNVGRSALKHGVKKIHISSILPRWGFQYRNAIVRVNNLLQQRCVDENFLFMDHSDITPAHISGDGIHPNFYGSTILKMNILSVFNSFNPFLCDFSQDYDKAVC